MTPVHEPHEATPIPSIPPQGYLLIIGAMKCGTTTLFDALRQHPAICPSVVKEPEYFTRHQRHGGVTASYESLWPEFSSQHHQYALEASTGYTKHPTEAGVPQRMAEYGIEPRLIYIVRNPFERIVSHVSYVKRNTKRTLQPTDQHVLAASRYFSQITEYRLGLPTSPLLVIDFADLAADMASVTRRVFEFAELDTSVPLSLERRNALDDGSTVARRLRKGSAHRVIDVVPPSWRRAGVRVLAAAEPKPKRRQVLTEHERAVIHAALASDMTLLHREYGVNVQSWGFDV